MNASVNVIYKGKAFEVIVDGAGLDIAMAGTTTVQDLMTGVGHELFVNLFDANEYATKGLEAALVSVGAKVVA